MYSIRSNDNTILPMKTDLADSKELMESVESAENYDFLSSSLNENAELAENKIEVISFKKNLSESLMSTVVIAVQAISI